MSQFRRTLHGSLASAHPTVEKRREDDPNGDRTNYGSRNESFVAAVEGLLDGRALLDRGPGNRIPPARNANDRAAGCVRIYRRKAAAKRSRQPKSADPGRAEADSR